MIDLATSKGPYFSTIGMSNNKENYLSFSTGWRSMNYINYLIVAQEVDGYGNGMSSGDPLTVDI